jgi:hypothetical protein
MVMVKTAAPAPDDIDDDPLVKVVETIRAAMDPLTTAERRAVAEAVAAWVEAEAWEDAARRAN